MLHNFMRLQKNLTTPEFHNMFFFNEEIISFKMRYVVAVWAHGLSQYLETGCPNRGFIDFCVSKVWYKVHTANKINPLYLQILLFLGQ